MKRIKINPQKNKTIHVVAAVIENDQSQIFIAKRPQHTHQGGLWEFPGGKVEKNESPTQALKRELHEELGIQITAYEPLIQISHEYPDKSIFLDVWQVTQFDGAPYGKEGQTTSWVDKHALNNYAFPAANTAIVKAATLPPHYLITPEPDLNALPSFLNNIEKKLSEGVQLIQLRAKNLSPATLKSLYLQVQTLTKPYQVTLLINAPISLAQDIQADGVHLSSAALLSTTQRPTNLTCAASCHTTQEVAHANTLGLDFIVISPVLKTNSHPNATPLQWPLFTTLCKQATSPVYALGGMTLSHLDHAKLSGAQGIAAITALWCHNKD